MICNNSDKLELYLSILMEEIGTDNKQDVLKTLLKIMRNVQQNPTSDKFRMIRKENQTFNSKVWKWESAQQFLYSVGWIDIGDSIILAETDNISKAISLLEESLSGCSAEMDISAHNSPVTQESERDKELKQAQQKLMERLKKERDERQKIKDQIKLDRQNVSSRETKASKARDLKFGSNIKKFSDIGVDLNRGGG